MNKENIENLDQRIKSLEEEQKTLKESVRKNTEDICKNNSNFITVTERIKSDLIKVTSTRTHNSIIPTVYIKPQFKCKECSQIFENKPELNDHLRTVHTQTITCKLCKAEFQESHQLEKHLLSDHKSIRSHEFDECGMKYVVKWRL